MISDISLIVFQMDVRLDRWFWKYDELFRDYTQIRVFCLEINRLS